MPIIKCKICSKKKEFKLSHIKKGQGKYCSKKCKGIAQIGKNNPNWKGGWEKNLPKCKNCGKKTNTYYAELCIKCLGKLHSGKNNPKWKGGKPKCKNCGKELVGYGSKMCYECYSKYAKSENHPSWQGGKSFEPYTPEFNPSLKRMIRDRDGHKCQLCGVPEIECNRELDVHHIDYNKKNCNPKNLISLDRKCNLKVNKDRNKWEKYFKDLMANRNKIEIKGEC